MGITKKYLDGINHPDTCWAIRPLYSVPVSLLSPEHLLDNAESRTLDPSDFLARQLSWALSPLGHTVMRQALVFTECILKDCCLEYYSLKLMLRFFTWRIYHTLPSISGYGRRLSPLLSMSCLTCMKYEVWSISQIWNDHFHLKPHVWALDRSESIGLSDIP